MRRNAQFWFGLAPLAALAVVAATIKRGAPARVSQPERVASRRFDPPDVGLAELPVRAAYDALAEAEAAHEARFWAAVDPDAAEAALKRRVAELVAAPLSGGNLIGLGRELFLADLGRPRTGMSGHVGATRCAACHHRGSLGGSGGAVDDLYLRNAPSLAGAGLLERLALELTADLRTLSARHRPLVTHGIDFGTTEHPVGVRPDLIVRPFGRDGKWSTLEEAIREMQTAALGVTDSPGVGHALEAFVAAIPAPGIEPPDAAQMPDLFNHFNAGQRRFREFGCAKCHVPEIPLADGSVVRAYTDLKTHDLGPGPAGSPRTAWVTSPLWGVAASAPYLHDGRALSSLDLAIIYHGGEAATAAAEYQRSGPLAQGELRIFLVSLSPTPRLRIVDR